MYTVPEALVLGFLIGLTGALAPGPTLIATINTAMRDGWTAGPRVTFGHIAVETAMVLLIIAGIHSVIGAYTAIIAGIGGSALVFFGALTLRESRHAHVDFAPGADSAARPFLAGVITSISNPYFWIWWFTVGSALLISTYQGGILVVAAFVLGHWAADMGWLTLVSSGIHKGRFVLGEKGYRATLAVCGVFLMGFGVYYISSIWLMPS